MIDFGYLKSFAIKKKNLVRRDFKRKTNDIPGFFGDIADIRNKWAHHAEIDTEEYARTFSNLIFIFSLLKMNEMVEDLKKLRDKKKRTKPKNEPKNQEKTDHSSLIPWYKNVKPHIDIQQGLLDESGICR
ncbi:MAG: hypothetical protein U5Q03_04150 [Bacteroidota bacterium]|nr:hypothetical protein [Bacteroidota bacterium]